jgi:hypothetical protein
MFAIRKPLLLLLQRTARKGTISRITYQRRKVQKIRWDGNYGYLKKYDPGYRCSDRSRLEPRAEMPAASALQGTLYNRKVFVKI